MLTTPSGPPILHLDPFSIVSWIRSALDITLPHHPLASSIIFYHDGCPHTQHSYTNLGSIPVLSPTPLPPACPLSYLIVSAWRSLLESPCRAKPLSHTSPPVYDDYRGQLKVSPTLLCISLGSALLMVYIPAPPSQTFTHPLYTSSPHPKRSAPCIALSHQTLTPSIISRYDGCQAVRSICNTPMTLWKAWYICL